MTISYMYCFYSGVTYFKLISRFHTHPSFPQSRIIVQQAVYYFIYLANNVKPVEQDHHAEQECTSISYFLNHPTLLIHITTMRSFTVTQPTIVSSSPHYFHPYLHLHPFPLSPHNPHYCKTHQTHHRRTNYSLPFSTVFQSLHQTYSHHFSTFHYFSMHPCQLHIVIVDIKCR